MEGKTTFEFKDLSAEEKERRGILGRLYGPCASISIPTRNGRFYSEALWEKVFGEKDSITAEMFKNGGIPMELDHPTDREETCSDRIAAMLPEPPKRDNKNQLVCCVDIIDTPCGKIAYQLAKYGFNLGISSRGSGETFTDSNGNESVDPDSYDFQTFDLVLLPAVKEARLKLMTESLDGKTFKQALKETLDKASPESREIMEKTLSDLNIDYNQEEKGGEVFAADNDGAELLKTLQETLLAKDKADVKITELQEKLSVCYAKESELEEDLNKYKVAIRNFSDTASSVKKLQEEMKILKEKLTLKDKALQTQREKFEALRKRQSLSESRKTNLMESLSAKTEQLEKANRKIEMLSESIKQMKDNYSQDKQTLTENYESLKKDYKIKQAEYSTKLSTSNKLVEQYKKTAKKAVNYYIESKAGVLGISVNEVLNKLPKNYSFSDIDSVCESLSEYKLQMNNLPFNVRDVKTMTITESKKLPNVLGQSPINDGDDVDEGLIRLANSLITNQ